ncbi:MAG: hypothetical protein K0S70_101 [Microbacterium sp.]|jgi:hypothetical protein|nr:hypothetical protein [Microbacterium sp.]
MTRSRVETTAYVAFVRRILKALARRAGEEDEHELSLLMALEDEVRECIRQAVARQRDRGVSWDRIALSAGTSRQAVTKRWKGVGQ